MVLALCHPIPAPRISGWLLDSWKICVPPDLSNKAVTCFRRKPEEGGRFYVRNVVFVKYINFITPGNGKIP